MPEPLLDNALALHRQGNLTEAERLYRLLLARSPDDTVALHHLGLICNQTGRFTDAVGFISKALAINPAAAAAYNDLGYAFQALRRYEEAIGCYRRAIELVPDFIEAHANLGGVLQSLGRPDEAIAVFERAIAIRPIAEIHINAGATFAALGRHDEALAHYEQALVLRPESADASNNLGVSLAALGRLAEAISHYERALALRPDSAETRNNLGSALATLGRHEDAVAYFRDALAIQPNHLQALANIGHCCIALGWTAEAMTHFDKALDLNPRYADAHFQIGRALVVANRLAEAIVHFDMARREMPGNLDFRIHLADALAVENRLDGAADRYREAIAAGADLASVHTNLGNVLVASGQVEPALPYYERALALDELYVEAHRGWASAQILLGHFDEARQAIEQALALAPHETELYRFLVDLVPLAEDDRHLLAMEALVADPSALPENDGASLHFALGKAYDDLGRHDDAFEHWQQANALLRRRINYDEHNRHGILQRTAAVFTPELIAAKRGAGDPSEVPIFIVGMPRSGTTLVEQILASHPQVFGAGESKALNAVIDEMSGAGKFPETVLAMDAEHLRRIGAGYLAAVASRAPPAARITDKMPTNFVAVGLIRLALPNAKIVHVRRDPVDTCLSCFSRLFTTLPFTADLGELGRYYRAYDALMAHWRRVLPPSAMLEVQYEELVADFEPQARRLLAYCGLEWDDACTSFHQTRRSVHTASAVQVRRPLYRSAVGRSQPYRDMLRPLLDALEIA